MYVSAIIIPTFKALTFAIALVHLYYIAIPCNNVHAQDTCTKVFVTISYTYIYMYNVYIKSICTSEFPRRNVTWLSFALINVCDGDGVPRNRQAYGPYTKLKQLHFNSGISYFELLYYYIYIYKNRKSEIARLLHHTRHTE